MMRTLCISRITSDDSGIYGSGMTQDIILKVKNSDLYPSGNIKKYEIGNAMILCSGHMYKCVERVSREIAVLRSTIQIRPSSSSR
jgi:hypothetical protein